MLFSTTLFLHIAGALVGLISGWIAIVFRKGSRGHGVSGDLFVIAMVVMTVPAIGIALFKHQPINVLVGALTFYLAVSAWLTVWRKPGELGLPEIGLTLLALSDAALLAALGWRAAHSPNGAMDDIPAAFFFVFGSVAALGGLLDLRVLLRGGVQGAARIARHLWRMCFALFITTLSTFFGKRMKFPEPLRSGHLLDLPMLILVGLTIYWLVRVRIAPRFKKNWAARSVQPAAAKPLPGAIS